MKAVKHIEKYGMIKRKEYEELYKVSGRTANRGLDDLSRKDLIEKRGSGPGIRYVLARYGKIRQDKSK